MAADDILYTVKQVAQIIHTNKSYVYKLIKSGVLPALKLGALKIRRETLLQFLIEKEASETSKNGIK